MADRKLCDCCQKQPASIAIGAALLCRRCDIEVRQIVRAQHRRGESVNGLEIAVDLGKAPVLRLKPEVYAVASAKAEHLRRTTGKDVAWSDVVHQWLDQAAK